MSAEHFREFVNERLAAAAEEIFGAFRRTVVEYEGEIDRQRRMLETFCKPEIRLHRIGVYIQLTTAGTMCVYKSKLGRNIQGYYSSSVTPCLIVLYIKSRTFVAVFRSLCGFFNH